MLDVILKKTCGVFRTESATIQWSRCSSRAKKAAISFFVVGESCSEMASVTYLLRGTFV